METTIWVQDFGFRVVKEQRRICELAPDSPEPTTTSPCAE